MNRLYETAFRRVLYPAYESGLRRRGTLRYLAQYERDQWLSTDEIMALQWRKLERLLDYCWTRIPYYRDRWTGLGIERGDIRSHEDYARLPVLDKTEIRANEARLRPRDPAQPILFKATSGSTGEPLRIGYTRESYERRIAVMYRGYGWSGGHLGRRTLYLWGQPSSGPDWKERMYQAALQRCTLNAFAMTDERLGEYAAAIDRYQPRVIVSYVAPIVRIARWLLENGRRPHRPDVILSAAEALHEGERALVEQAFGCPMQNTYGCREVMLIAAECPHRGGLHANADHLVVELVGGGGDEASDLVITDLHNYGMPLLRYANGDMARAGGTRCACGRGLPKLAGIEGRRLDILRTADGRQVFGEHIVYAFLGAAGIDRWQVVQDEPDAWDIALVPGRDYAPSVVEKIERDLRPVCGEGTRLRFHTRDAIALTPAGKRRPTINNLAAKELK